jgi:Tn3 transposase DDE domain-containing protein
MTHASWLACAPRSASRRPWDIPLPDTRHIVKRLGEAGRCCNTIGLPDVSGLMTVTARRWPARGSSQGRSRAQPGARPHRAAGRRRHPGGDAAAVRDRRGPDGRQEVSDRRMSPRRGRRVSPLPPLRHGNRRRCRRGVPARPDRSSRGGLRVDLELHRRPNAPGSWTASPTPAAQARTPELKRNLIAVLLAHSANLGLTRMADACGISYDTLAWTVECGRLGSRRRGVPRRRGNGAGCRACAGVRAARAT